MAKEYLKLALRFKADYYKHILAVTFTNKSTQEMKDRILAYLSDFAMGKPNPLAEELKLELKLDDQAFRLQSQELLAAILHGYAQFSISTIDAFFQKVIRSFTREAGLVGDYRLELDTNMVLEEVIDRLMDELGKNENLTRWLVDFANESLENARAWDVRSSLIQFAQEIFKEDFKEIEDKFLQVASQPDFFVHLRSELQKQKYSFVHFMSSRGRQAVEMIQANGLDDEDFKWGARGGVYSYFRKLANVAQVADLKDPGKRPENDFLDAGEWPAKKTGKTAAIIAMAKNHLIPLLQETNHHYRQYFKQALSAEVVLSNFYAFGLLFDISHKLMEYKEEHSMMLLADAPKFLNGLIADTDAPFIYEKVGSFYKNFLIDEFQDTSGMQWRNFMPLVENSLAQGMTCTVVGDVKQAIYRWRGGDLGLLQEKIEQGFSQHRVGTFALNQNFRSAATIIEFNNALFKSMADLVVAKTGNALAGQVYQDVEQQVVQGLEGFVRIKFFKDEKEERWQDKALMELTQTLELWQQQGIPLKDVAILVRKRSEGQTIVNHLIQYKHSGQAKAGCQYDVISSESLLLEGASSVNLLLAAIRYLANPDNAIARAQLGYEFARHHEPERILTEVFSVTNQMTFENNLPEAFTKAKMSLKKLPLFELTETLIEIFKLGTIIGEIPYLQAFQDVVLEFSSRERSDINAFLEWWEMNKHNKSIQVPEQVDAAQILTIHKSKGLQFKYCIIPFCFWSLDHEGMKQPLIWVKSDQGLFENAGYLPVKYSSTLENTIFASAYEEENIKIYLDNLNLLYVALTRAEQGLMVIAPASESKAIKNSSAGILYDGIQQSLLLLERWNAQTLEWQKGSNQTADKKEDHTSTIRLTHYPSYSWREKLVIRQSCKDYFSTGEETSAVQTKRNMGIYVHQVLSRIRYQEDVDRVLCEITNEGWLTSSELPDVKKMISDLLTLAPVADWFSKDWEVKTEVSILMPGGEESRIDRLLIKNNKALVIDYKSGEAKSSDQQQVKQYMDVIRSMNFEMVDGFLLYLKTNTVVSVPPGKVKTSKKKNESQLGLDF